MSDDDLLRLARGGDRSAFRLLYEHHLPSVWRYVRAHVIGDRHTVEDVVSETFLAAVRGLPSLAPGRGSVSGWLIGIARHKIGDLRRGAGRFERGDNDLAGSADDDPDLDPIARLERAETRSRVAAIMDGLDDDERLVLEWKYLDDLPVREIARRLGRTEKAVEAQLFRARRSFRSRFERVSHRTEGVEP